MHRRNLLIALLAATLLALAWAPAALASAEPRLLRVLLASGSQVELVVEVPDGVPVDQVPLPGVTEPVVSVEDLGPAPTPTATPTPSPAPTATATPRATPEATATPRARPRNRASGKGSAPTPTPTPTPSATTAPSATATPAPTPAFTPGLPDAADAIRVPGPTIDSFRIPPFLLPIYQAAGVEYGVRWEVLAAINEVETDYGRNVRVSSAGALGWMQFMPASWRAYGTDGNGDGRRDPANPVDAIFAAARYLRAAGAERDLRAAVFAYNHANWYVDLVLERARLIGALPADLVGSLTGLAQGRFPVQGERTRRASARRDAASLSRAGRRTLRIRTRPGAPVVAVQDGRIVRTGSSPRLGRYVQLQDHYGNTYTYAHLGRIARSYAAPRREASLSPRAIARELELPAPDAKPSSAASGTSRPTARRRARTPAARRTAPAATRIPAKARLFANPARPRARRAGGARQLGQDDRIGGTRYLDTPGPVAGLDRRDVVVRRLRAGARVPSGTVLGSVARARAGARRAVVELEIRPAGRGAPRIDPLPIVEGWRLLESTALYRVREDTALGRGATIGQLLLMSKEALVRRVLVNPRIEVYACGRRDIRAGQVDRRVLATLEFLAASGLRPTVTSLRCGHGYYTKSGNVSHHTTGSAVDIAALNGIPVLGNQGPGSITELAVQRLLTLQGTMRPDQIISLMSFEGATNTIAMSDHADHLHLGWRPQFGANGRAARAAEAVLGPGEWTRLIERLGRLENPRVPLRPSRHALETTKRPSAAGTRGETE